MLSILRELASDDEGATAIEYALIAAFISVAAIAAYTAVGSSIDASMSSTASKF